MASQQATKRFHTGFTSDSSESDEQTTIARSIETRKHSATAHEKVIAAVVKHRYQN